eukprot:GILJ01012899.1.p1 GENE.GILJ01012899.1~~GILJ01012899.1.p1  ORF type:complete len:614 (-),score=55.80 GILJ01012899.1:142-1983(-)
MSLLAKCRLLSSASSRALCCQVPIRPPALAVTSRFSFRSFSFSLDYARHKEHERNYVNLFAKISTQMQNEGSTTSFVQSDSKEDIRQQIAEFSLRDLTLFLKACTTVTDSRIPPSLTRPAVDSFASHVKNQPAKELINILDLLLRFQNLPAEVQETLLVRVQRAEFVRNLSISELTTLIRALRPSRGKGSKVFVNILKAAMRKLNTASAVELVELGVQTGPRKLPNNVLSPALANCLSSRMSSGAFNAEVTHAVGRSHILRYLALSAWHVFSNVEDPERILPSLCQAALSHSNWGSEPRAVNDAIDVALALAELRYEHRGFLAQLDRVMASILNGPSCEGRQALLDVHLVQLLKAFGIVSAKPVAVIQALNNMDSSEFEALSPSTKILVLYYLSILLEHKQPVFQCILDLLSAEELVSLAPSDVANQAAIVQWSIKLFLPRPREPTPEALEQVIPAHLLDEIRTVVDVLDKENLKWKQGFDNVQLPHEISRGASMNRSSFEDKVIAIIRRNFGYNIRPQVFVPPYYIDCVVPVPKRKGLAVEVEGPFHFLTSNTTRRVGSSVLKYLHLQALGYKVVPIPYFQWIKHSGRQAQQTFINSCIENAIDSYDEPDQF